MNSDKPTLEFDHRGRKLRAELRTTASPQHAWEAWADPEKIAQWFTDKAEGQAVAGATVTWIFERFNYRIPYEVLAADPGERFAIRWVAQPGRDDGIVDVRITREGGETLIRLVNSGFREGAEWNDEYEGVASGWQMALAILKNYLEHYFGRPKTQFLALRPAVYTNEQLKPFFTTREGLSHWLAKPFGPGPLGKIGEGFSFELQDGGPVGNKVSGRILAITPTEITLSWEELRGTLELKAFSMGPGNRMVGLRGLSWGTDSAKMQELEKAMEPALDRLVAALSKPS